MNVIGILVEIALTQEWNCFPIFFFNLFIVGVEKTTDFCKSILYPATLLKLFMVSRSFGVEVFWFLIYRIMSSANSNTLTISLPIFILFITASCLIALARNSRMMLNRSPGERGHPCLFL
jgi:hypothetical protein